MKYVSEEKGMKRIYQVNFDKDEMRELVNGVIDCGYETKEQSSIGTNMVIPDLVEIAYKLIAGKDEAVTELIDYKDSIDFISIDEMIENTKNKFKSEEIKNMSYEEKLELINDLKELVIAKKNGQYMNVPKLKERYEEIKNLLSFDLVAEAKTIPAGSKVYTYKSLFNK